MDECKFNISDCDVNANCTNTFGSYKCTCKVGYIGDGRSCSGSFNISIFCYSSHNFMQRYPCMIMHRVTTIYIFCYTFCNGKRNYMTMGHKNDKVQNLSIVSQIFTSATCMNTKGSHVCTCHPGYTENGSDYTGT